MVFWDEWTRSVLEALRGEIGLCAALTGEDREGDALTPWAIEARDTYRLSTEVVGVPYVDEWGQEDPSPQPRVMFWQFDLTIITASGHAVRIDPGQRVVVLKHSAAKRSRHLLPACRAALKAAGIKVMPNER